MSDFIFDTSTPLEEKDSSDFIFDEEKDSSSSSSGNATGCSSPMISDNDTSPIISDNEDFVQMDQLNYVKRLLRMFPPPTSAEDFIGKNPFHASDGHIRRPSNNFILFRKIAHDQKNQTPALSVYNERQFSEIIGKIWKGLSRDEKLTYKRLGKEVAEIHKKLFPKYKYQPKRDKAAWKHFKPEINNSNQKSKRKNKVKQQKNQETISNIPQQHQQQHNQQQQQQIVPDNTLNYGLPVVGLDQMGQMGQMSPIDQLYYQSPYTIDLFNEEYWMQQI